MFMERNDLFMTEYSKTSTLGNIRCFRRCWGGGKGYEVRNEGEFDKALSESLSNDTEVSLIRVHIGREDHSPTIDRLGAGLTKIVHS